MKDEHENLCEGCYWYEQCQTGKGCEDYTPYGEAELQWDDCQYNFSIRENTEEYFEFLREFDS